MKAKLPTTVFVTLDENDAAGDGLLAYRHIPDAVDGDGPTTVAQYRLISKAVLSKQVTGRWVAQAILLFAICGIFSAQGVAREPARHRLPVRIVMGIGRNLGETGRTMIWPCSLSRGSRSSSSRTTADPGDPRRQSARTCHWEEWASDLAQVGASAFDSYTTIVSQRYCRTCVETSPVLGPHPSPVRTWTIVTSSSLGFNLLNHIIFKYADTPARRIVAPIPNLLVTGWHIDAGQGNRHLINRIIACQRTPGCSTNL